MWSILKATYKSFRQHDGPLLSGALAFYMLLAVAPLGVLILLIVGAVFGREAASGELMTPLGNLLGDATAEFISDLIERAQAPAGSWWASAITGGEGLTGAARYAIDGAPGVATPASPTPQKATRAAAAAAAAGKREAAETTTPVQ